MPRTLACLALGALLALSQGAWAAARSSADLQARSSAMRSAARPRIRAVRLRPEVFDERLRAESQRLGELSAGLVNALKIDALETTERLYLHEVRALDLLVSIADQPRSVLPAKRRAVLLEEARALVRRVLYQKDMVVGPHALATVRAAIPGEPMAQLGSLEGRDTYAMLDRADTVVRDTRTMRRARRSLYTARMAEFLGAGGKETDIVRLDASFLREVPSGTLITWAHRTQDNEVWASLNGKHVVTAGGEDAFGGGELKIYKDRRGEILLAVLSNSSGAIKSGTGSLEAPAALLEGFGIPRSRIVYTSQSPAEPQLIKLLLVSDKSLSVDEITGRMALARAKAGIPERTKR